MRVVITGSSSGLGRAAASDLLARGHEVWGWARSDQSAFAAAHGGRFRHTRVNVGAWGEVHAAAEAGAKRGDGRFRLGSKMPRFGARQVKLALEISQRHFEIAHRHLGRGECNSHVCEQAACNM